MTALVPDGFLPSSPFFSSLSHHRRRFKVVKLEVDWLFLLLLNTDPFEGATFL